MRSALLLAALLPLMTVFGCSGAQIQGQIRLGHGQTVPINITIPGDGGTVPQTGTGTLGNLGTPTGLGTATGPSPMGEWTPTLATARDTGLGNALAGSTIQPSSDAEVQEVGRRLDAYLEKYPRSNLRGKGQIIAACSAQYGVPVDLAMGMFKMEASYCQEGTLAARCNNPGNIKDTNGKYGQIVGRNGDFPVYASVETGIEAYFRLLSNPSGPYWKHIQAGDYAAVFETYAPSSDGNNLSDYNQTVAEVRQEIGQVMNA